MIDPFDVAADFEYPSENGVRLCQMCRCEGCKKRRAREQAYRDVPERRAARALLMRMRYHGVADPRDLPGKYVRSSKGNKS